ncbi:Uncharacterised protein [Chlamydia trachomatis]|nr:Uncharacterised protein [Chlamydia trachomatis]
MVATASTPPAAPKQCPINDFVEFIRKFLTWLPKAFFKANTSDRSPRGVDVPCALI